jgi:hypothetical protein
MIGVDFKDISSSKCTPIKVISQGTDITVFLSFTVSSKGLETNGKQQRKQTQCLHSIFMVISPMFLRSNGTYSRDQIRCACIKTVR